MNHTPILDEEYVVDDLVEGARYEFRIIAMNVAGGRSYPSDTTGEVTCQELYEAPSINLDQSMVEGLCVRAGEDVELEAKIEGKPAPKVTWAFK
jgi:hypothetical protein